MFLRLASRLGVYGGVLAARIATETKAQQAPSRKQSALPVASAAQIKNMLGRAPGVDMWVDVKEVRADG